MNVKTPMRILLVDDHVLFRSGIKAELSAYPHLQVVGEAANGHEAVDLARERKPDVILMDIQMEKCTGLEAVASIKRELPGVRVIILTVHDEDDCLFEAIRRGADGYLLKDIEPGELLDMLSKVSRGEAAINGRLAVKILNEFHSPGKPAPAPPPAKEALTEREVRVLERLAAGDSNLQIARALVISENTVKMHMSNILNKLHLENRIQAAVYAVREGLVSTSP